MQSLGQVDAMDADQRVLFGVNQIEPTLKFLFGPLTNRGLASPQRGVELKIDWGSAALVGERVVLKYDYRSTWIVDKDVPESFNIPVPFNRNDLLTPRWKNCTDSSPEHQTEWFYWYFWDPERTGCDHKQGVQYDVVTVRLGEETKNQSASYPEYNRLLEGDRFHLTFGFGYVEDPAAANPETDWDSGIREYQAFVKNVRGTFGSSFRE
ncbi:MAG: hypothetical protein ACXWQO_14200, partial [Bdellovibrionota bacterium]